MDQIVTTNPKNLMKLQGIVKMEKKKCLSWFFLNTNVMWLVFVMIIMSY